MTIEQTIKKATEGGWNGYDGQMHESPMLPEQDCKVYLLDPKFWQALGKAMRWSWRTECCNIWYDKKHPKKKPPEEYHHHTWGMGKWTEEWLYQATHYFKDYAMKGKSAEEFFEKL